MSLPRYFSTNIVTIENNYIQPYAGISEYFENHKTVLGDYVDTQTVIFPNGFAIPPIGLPAPTSENFDFYINGTLVERVAITSFTNGITTSTLILDTNMLGFSIESNDKIIAIGKFN
jgi:hypothetical protein